MNNEKETINYYEDHEEGDTGLINALKSSKKDAHEYHDVELYNPPASLGVMLKWKCERCQTYYADPQLFEDEPCIPWGES